MPCSHTPSELSAYLDGELTAGESAAFEAHLRACPACQAAHAAGLQIRAAFQTSLPYHRAPAALLHRIEAALALEPSSQPKPQPAPLTSPASRNPLRIWRALAITAAAACVLFTLFLFRTSSAADDQLAQEVVSNHIRSMMAAHLMDVASLDRHTVKPWFDGKLDFAPPVKDTSAQGFPLVGGRLDYVAGRPVAALVFKRSQHVINLFVWTSAKPAYETQRVLNRQGYNLVYWTQSGMTFWAVSDVELPQLQQFAAAQQTAP